MCRLYINICIYIFHIIVKHFVSNNLETGHSHHGSPLFWGAPRSIDHVSLMLSKTLVPGLPLSPFPANVPVISFFFVCFYFAYIRTPAMIGCSFVVNRGYFGELGLLDSGMDVYGGENIELGIRVCVLPLHSCRFSKWSSSHRTVTPLMNEVPLPVLPDLSCVGCLQQDGGEK